MLILSLLLVLAHAYFPSSANIEQSTGNFMANGSCHFADCCDFRWEG